MHTKLTLCPRFVGGAQNSAPAKIPCGHAGTWHVLVALLLLAALPMPAAWAQQSRVYTVEKLSIEASAADAVAAKKKAIAEAERRAMNIVLWRITPFSAYERLPKPKASLIEDMLEGFSVRREASSGTQYLATLDFTFQPDAVRQFLQGYAIPYTETQAPPISLLPILLRDGKLVKSGSDAWRKAWSGLDLDHTLTPVRLLPLESAVTDQRAQAILSGDEKAFEALSNLYREDVMVVAVASADGKQGKLQTRLYGTDGAGPIDLTRFDRIGPGDLNGAAKRSATIALRILEGRWKLSKSPLGGVSDDEQHVNFAVTAEFAGLSQWQKMRSRLTRVPGVQSLNIVSLSARSANVTMEFPGGAERLSQQLRRRDLNLQNESGAWILRSN
jgi:hypothetical protein